MLCKSLREAVADPNVLIYVVESTWEAVADPNVLIYVV